MRSQSPVGRVTQRASTSLLIPLFVVSLAIPINLHAGPLRLSPDRIILIALFLPCLALWISGQLGKIRLPDVLILLTSLWGMLALTIHHGVAATWETSGILLIETLGSYLLARKLIRSKEDFRAMVRVFFWVVCALLPFAAIESLTERKLLLDLSDGLFDTLNKVYMTPRYGLYRAQVTFEHPILYGVFCASGLGLVYYVLGSGRSLAHALLRASVIAAAAACSLSAGAVASIATQFGLVAWDRIVNFARNRWRLLAILGIAAYVAVDLLSNRTPFHVFVSYLTFSPSTGYGRMIIFNYGFAEVLRNPLLGIGLGDWARPEWLGGSMDNFWLVVAVRFGLPAFFLLAGAVFVIIRALARLKLDDERIRACRAGLLVTLGGLILAACTVHYWNAIYVWFMFLIGSGQWMLHAGNAAHDIDRRASAVRPRNAGNRGPQQPQAPDLSRRHAAAPDASPPLSGEQRRRMGPARDRWALRHPGQEGVESQPDPTPRR